MGMKESLDVVPLALQVLFWLNMEVLNYMALEADQSASLAFLAFVGHADAADMESYAAGMAAGMESIIDIEEVLEL